MPTKKNKATDTTKMEEKFCEAYATVGSETYSDAPASALAAGYAESSYRAAASKLIHNPRLLERMKEIRAEQMARTNVDADKVILDLQHGQLLALRSGKVAEYAKFCELIGKSLGLFVDRVGFEIGQREKKELTEAEKEEAIRYSEWRLLQESREEAQERKNSQDESFVETDVVLQPQ